MSAISIGWKRALLAIGFVFAALIVVIGICLWIIFQNPFNNENFVRTTWLSAATSNKIKNPRGPMAEDVNKNYLHLGMTKKEVRRLLGKPANRRYYESRDIDRYYLGHWGYMCIDGAYLIIHYNKNNRLKYSEIYSH